MIISRTPFRVSFVGGGTDFFDFYSKSDYGSVISTSIKKYMYIIIHPYFQNKIRLKYSKTEDVNNVNEIKHPIIKECLKKININSGIEISSYADIPSGTGLGSSSSFTVGLLHALYAYKGVNITKKELAEKACEIEIDILKEPIGKQDQYAASIGGLNIFRFLNNGDVDIHPIALNDKLIKLISNNFHLYYTGKTRKAKTILHEQKSNILNDTSSFNILKQISDLTPVFTNNIKIGDMKQCGICLSKNWELKKLLANNISNSHIDNLYDKAVLSGAYGGKLLGAGQAGFFLVISEHQNDIKKSLNCDGFELNIDFEGTKIIYSD